MAAILHLPPIAHSPYMQLSHLLGAGVLIAALGFSVRSDATDANRGEALATGPSAADATLAADLTPGTPVSSPDSTQPPLTSEPVADGHYVLVVEGDRNGLAVTFARKKADRWAGTPKGFASNWMVSIRDVADRELAKVPLDVSPFATDARSLGQPARVQGCVIVDSKIGLLLNVPAFVTAASYVFTRTDNVGVSVALGTTSGDAVRELAGGGR
jgi:hypothetical protein